MERFVCIHCHFYQPPRENPWLESVEVQDSARPYHDWNERILAECYRPNGASRILDEQGRIAQIVNNYARISFNFGPTLLSWIERQAPQTYAHILQADRESKLRFSGHGSALAQAYNHIILPLANARDRQTQIAWGIQDFQHRFGRDPEGMWLPETAVDSETLELLSSAGIKFTVLSPYQALRMRRDPNARWTDIHGHGIDSRRPYRCQLPSGRSLGLFFYDGVVARDVAFDKLLFDGMNLARRLASRFDPHGEAVQLVHIATDGETYGHHHAHGDMALAYALDFLERSKLAKLTNYGEYFAAHPPTHEVEIRERTSWSCAHGVGRWYANCGCKSTVNGHWGQEWRAPLRQAFDWLRDSLQQPFEKDARQFLRDPGAARDAYVQVILNPSPQVLNTFMAQHGSRELSQDERTRVLRLLEMQRYLLLMYTSCGWFFDEPSGPEAVQVLRYAARAVQLGKQLFGGSLEQEFLQRLEAVRSNIQEFGNGRDIYNRFIRPSMLDMCSAAAHYAIASMFDGYFKRESIYGYAANLHDAQVFAEQGRKLAVGQACIMSRATCAQLEFKFAVLWGADHQLLAGIGPTVTQPELEGFTRQASAAFSQEDLAECIAFIKRHFGDRLYSVNSLFPDERLRIVTLLVDHSLADIDGLSRQIFKERTPPIGFFREQGVPVPPILHTLGQFVLGNAIQRALAQEKADFEEIRKLLDMAKQDGIILPDSLNCTLRHRLQTALERWRHRPGNRATMQNLEELIAMAKSSAFSVDLWDVQNQYYDVMQSSSSVHYIQDDPSSRLLFRKLGEELGIAPASIDSAQTAKHDEAPSRPRMKVSSSTAEDKQQIPGIQPSSQLPM